MEDTVDDLSSSDVSHLCELETNEFSKSTGVVVVDGLGVPKSLQYRTIMGGHMESVVCVCVCPFVCRFVRTNTCLGCHWLCTCYVIHPLIHA